MKKRLFGTDGIRGIANIELTPELITKLGKATSYVLRENKGEYVVIGKDTRISGDMIEGALISSITASGLSIIKLGVTPTPSVPYFVKLFNAKFGIMISASHNPVEDNGIKIFDNTSFKLTDEQELKIEKYIFDKEPKFPFSPTTIGVVKDYKDLARQKYVEYLKKQLPKGNFKLKLVIDCANGAASDFIQYVFDNQENFEIIPLNNKADGMNINLQCGCLYPEIIKNKVREVNAHLGVSFDGDADRVIMVDEEGNIINGDHFLYLLALDFKNKNLLKNNLIVATVMSNIGLEKIIKENNIEFIRCPVGDKYVVNELIKRGGNLGGEQAGHIIFLDYNPSSDGLFTTCSIIRIMIENNKKLSELTSPLITFPQYLTNVKVKNIDKLEEDEVIKEKIDEVKNELGEKGRILVRKSGTEPLIRIMIEGENEEKIKLIAEDIKNLIVTRLN